MAKWEKIVRRTHPFRRLIRGVSCTASPRTEKERDSKEWNVYFDYWKRIIDLLFQFMAIEFVYFKVLRLIQAFSEPQDQTFLIISFWSCRWSLHEKQSPEVRRAGRWNRMQQITSNCESLFVHLTSSCCFCPAESSVYLFCNLLILTSSLVLEL